VRRDALKAFAKRWEIRRLEQVADSLGVADREAGALAPARPAERRGTGAETPAPGVKLEGRPSMGEWPVAVAGASHATTVMLPRAAGPLFELPGIAPLPAATQAAARATQGMLDLWGGDGLALERLRAGVQAVRARAIHGLAVLPVAEGARPRHAKLVGVALAARDGTACYVPLAHLQGPNFTAEEARSMLALVLSDPLCEKVGHDLKRDRHVLRAAHFGYEGLAFDLHLGSFLCDATRDHSLEALARDVLGVTIEKLEAPERRGGPRAGLDALPVESTAMNASRAAACLFPLAAALTAQLESREQWPLYRELEHPLIDVLYRMERAGVALEPGALSEMSSEAAAEIARLERELSELAGEPVNLNSGPQTAKLLFEKFKLRPRRRTKTGYSTDSEVLEALAAEHPFPKLLLEYRTISKLKSTYLDALPAERDAVDGRVHTTFEQTGAATGRLSSSDPNLQTIPMRTPQGRAIRRAFVAAPGSVLIGADYSQIELRVMAHLSGDPNLIEAFRSGEDVHASTARRIFGVTGGELDPALRARAKIVNFGVMYGMGARSLAQQMGIALADAQEFISGYFRVYAGVRAYLDRTLEEARTRGWVATLLGRRRYLPQLAQGDSLQRSNAERAAINTPIQGSAADLVKLAMLRVDAELARAGRGARLLLQVHDELLVECPEPEADAVSQLVQREMEGCYPMSVPLTVSVGRGRSWFDVH
jgi:DNA polymerase-1